MTFHDSSHVQLCRKSETAVATMAQVVVGIASAPTRNRTENLMIKSQCGTRATPVAVALSRFSRPPNGSQNSHENSHDFYAD